MTNWYVIHEYETYDQDEPFHAWLVCGTFESKAKAELSALEQCFNEYCNNKPHRWLMTDQRKFKEPENIKQEDKIRIVRQVISNIGDRTSSTNQYWGIGFYVISSDKLKVNKNVVKINNIHKNIKDPEPKVSEAKKPVKRESSKDSEQKKDDSEQKRTDNSDSDSDSDYESESDYESGDSYDLSDEAEESDYEESDNDRKDNKQKGGKVESDSESEEEPQNETSKALQKEQLEAPKKEQLEVPKKEQPKTLQKEQLETLQKEDYESDLAYESE